MVDNFELPTKLDVSGVVFSLVTIQYTYKIPVIDLAKGKVGKKATKATLTITDIEHIVQEILEDHLSPSREVGKDYAIAIEWLEAAEM